MSVNEEKGGLKWGNYRNISDLTTMEWSSKHNHSSSSEVERLFQEISWSQMDGFQFWLEKNTCN